MTSRNRLPHFFHNDLQCGVRQRGELVGQSLHRQSSGHVRQEQPEQTGVMDFADKVHAGFLIVFRNIRKTRPRAFDIEREIHRSVVVNLAQPFIPQLVQEQRMAIQIFGRPFSVAQYVAQALCRQRILQEQRHIRRTTRDHFVELDAAAQKLFAGDDF